jgi:hypothetical protein
MYGFPNPSFKTNFYPSVLDASIVSNQYKVTDRPIIFDVPLPQGVNKEDFEKMSSASSASEGMSGSGGADSAHCAAIGIPTPIN